LHIFGKKNDKATVHCAVCNKELGRYKYKPNEEWDIDGLLCGDCHIEKTKEFILKQEVENCALCGKELIEKEDKNKAKWQWEMESGTLLCVTCFQKKDTEYSKRMNFCSICNGKLGMFFYHPKPAWHIEGNLCRKCWDKQNNTPAR
jgi:hypothetical protein